MVDAINKYRVECENVVQDVNFKIHLRKRLFEALSEYSQTPDIIEMRCAPELDTHINGQSCGASHKAKRPSPNTLHKKKGA